MLEEWNVPTGPVTLVYTVQRGKPTAAKLDAMSKGVFRLIVDIRSDRLEKTVRGVDSIGASMGFKNYFGPGGVSSDDAHMAMRHGWGQDFLNWARKTKRNLPLTKALKDQYDRMKETERKNFKKNK